MKKRELTQLPLRQTLSLRARLQIFRLLICGGCGLMTAFGRKRALGDWISKSIYEADI
jgi:hypothetical protein